MNNLFSVTNPFSNEKCDRENKKNCKKVHVNKEKTVCNSQSNESKMKKNNNGNNISTILNTINPTKGKNKLINQEKSTFSNKENNISDNTENYSSDELPEASVILSDSQLNYCKKEHNKTKSFKKDNSILKFFNTSNLNSIKKEDKHINKGNKHLRYYDNLEEDLEFPNPKKELSKSLKNNNNFDLKRNKDKNKLQSISDIKKSMPQNKKKKLNEMENKFSFNNSDYDPELPKSEDILTHSLEKNALNSNTINKMGEKINIFEQTKSISIKSIINNIKIQKENRIEKDNEDIDLPKPNEAIQKELSKNINENFNKCDNEKKIINKNEINSNENIKNNKNPFKSKESESFSSFGFSNKIKDIPPKFQKSKEIKNENNEKESQNKNIKDIKDHNKYPKVNSNNINRKNLNNNEDSDDDSIFPESKDLLTSALINNNTNKNNKTFRKIDQNNIPIAKDNIPERLNSLKEKRFPSIDNSLLNKNKKRPYTSINKDSEKINDYKKKVTKNKEEEKEDDDDDDDLNSLVTPEELFQKLTSEDEDDNKKKLIVKSKKDKLKKQNNKQVYEKNAFELMKKDSHQELSSKNSLKKEENKKDFIPRTFKLSSNVISTTNNDKNKKIDQRINNKLNSTDRKIKEYKKNNLKPKTSQKITNKTISKIRNKKEIKKNNGKASFQTILEFPKKQQKEQSKNNFNNEIKKANGKYDLDELVNNINIMNDIAENQKIKSYELIQKTLKKSENKNDLIESNYHSESQKGNFAEEKSSSDKLDFMNQQKERKETKKNDNKIIASISEDDKNNIYDEQFDMFKQMVKNFENEEFDEEAFKFDTPLLKVNNFEKSKQKISLDDYLKSGRLLSLKKKNIINNSYNGQGDKATFKCPYCKYEYYEEMEKSVYTALRDFLETNHMKKDGEIITFNIPLIKQYEFCRLHQAKLVIIPEGIKKGYPLHIRFDLLKQRIYNFKNDLFDIIYGKKKSYFRELSLNEYERLGINKARNFNSLINRFEKILVGYYGSKGFNIITKILQDMFFVKKQTSHENEDSNHNDQEKTEKIPKIVIKTEKILTYELSKPQEPFEYIQEVLVPECGIRLIAEDNHLNKEIEEDLKKAREIMRNSNDFGLVVHEDNDNDDN